MEWILQHQQYKTNHTLPAVVASESLSSSHTSTNLFITKSLLAIARSWRQLFVQPFATTSALLSTFASIACLSDETMDGSDVSALLTRSSRLLTLPTNSSFWPCMYFTGDSETTSESDCRKAARESVSATSFLLMTEDFLRFLALRSEVEFIEVLWHFSANDAQFLVLYLSPIAFLRSCIP